MFFSRHITRNTLTYGQTEFGLRGKVLGMFFCFIVFCIFAL
mgnify:CR=1 FL=1